jgi:hypothetical protein
VSLLLDVDADVEATVVFMGMLPSPSGLPAYCTTSDAATRRVLTAKSKAPIQRHDKDNHDCPRYHDEQVKPDRRLNNLI